jgi:hypothetical protein
MKKIILAVLIVLLAVVLLGAGIFFGSHVSFGRSVMTAPRFNMPPTAPFMPNDRNGQPGGQQLPPGYFGKQGRGPDVNQGNPGHNSPKGYNDRGFAPGNRPGFRNFDRGRSPVFHLLFLGCSVFGLLALGLAAWGVVRFLRRKNQGPGMPASLHCPHCGKPVQADWVNCPFCIQPLKGGPVEVSPAVEVPQEPSKDDEAAKEPPPGI